MQMNERIQFSEPARGTERTPNPDDGQGAIGRLQTQALADCRKPPQCMNRGIRQLFPLDGPLGSSDTGGRIPTKP